MKDKVTAEKLLGDFLRAFDAGSVRMESEEMLRESDALARHSLIQGDGAGGRPFKYEVVSEVGNVVAQTFTQFTAECCVWGLSESGHAGSWSVRKIAASISAPLTGVEAQQQVSERDIKLAASSPSPMPTEEFEFPRPTNLSGEPIPDTPLIKWHPKEGDWVNRHYAPELFETTEERDDGPDVPNLRSEPMRVPDRQGARTDTGRLAETVAPPPAQGGDECPCGGTDWIQADPFSFSASRCEKHNPQPSPSLCDVEKVIAWNEEQCLCGGPSNNRCVPCPHCKTVVALRALKAENERGRYARELLGKEQEENEILRSQVATLTAALEKIEKRATVPNHHNQSVVALVDRLHDVAHEATAALREVKGG